MLELDDFLALETSQGVFDSSGQFSLSREKALEKLAAFQLPGEMDWLLKVVQAAVRADFLEIDLRLSKSQAEFRFSGACRWRLEDIEGSFYDPESGGDRSLQALKEALWSVSLHNARPFCLVGENWPEALFWNGEQFSRQPANSANLTRLTVSHRKRGDSGFPILREVEAARRNASILQHLLHKAFPCPIPLRVDARRVDGFHLCPGHGLSCRSYPFALGLLTGQIPPLQCPQLAAPDEPSYVETSLHPELRKLVAPDSRASQPVAAAALLTGHVGPVGGGRDTKWKPFFHPCRIYWVSDGVVVDCRAFDLTERSCSIGLIASAEGLVTDLSGLCLQVNREYQDRLDKVCRLADDFVVRADLHFEAMLEKARSSGKWMFALMVVGGVSVTTLNPAFGLFMTFCGFSNYFTRASQETTISKQLGEDLRLLQRDWPRLAGGSRLPG
ncbi:hypothetical protein JST97_03060 [bacterium]|nr:hypothetical protein [bacterium]